MELREFAEQVLFGASLEEKLRSPSSVTDQRPGSALSAPAMPGRPAELRFKSGQTGKGKVPGLHDLSKPGERGRLLHFFANHELLATELMALVLLRFPDAPAAFRRGILQTLQQEQQHTRWYLNRMKDCGISFGDLPVSGYFWRAIAPMQSPLDYVSGLSLTFEQANLDFTRFFSQGFARVGDQETAALLENIYRDEISHVAYGLKWFRKWKDPAQSDWEAFCGQLKFPMSAQRAKGPVFNIEGRLAAGLDRQFIHELSVFAQSKGRTPNVFFFNPFAEGRIAQGKSYTPNQHQQWLQQDLENLPQFLCRQDDVVLVRQRPAASFLRELKEAGWVVPEFTEIKSGEMAPNDPLRERKLGGLRPWAWGPDSRDTLAPLFANVTVGSANPDDYYTENRTQLYSKEWSSGFLRKLCRGWNGERPAAGAVAKGDSTSWLCTENEVGTAASTLSEVSELIEQIRVQGHERIVMKEAIGVAGRNAIRLLEPELLEAQRRWIVAALQGGRRVVVEPWLERALDFSVQMEMDGNGLHLIGYTGLLNDWKGQYRGNWAGPAFRQSVTIGLERLFPAVPDIANQVRQLYREIARLLAEELRQVSYYGPVGIDAFIYRAPNGECRLKPVVEMNPRYTMGRLTAELMKNVVPGKTGTFRLINQKQAEADGFADFRSWARTAMEQSPLHLTGEPVSKIAEGLCCLNDPDRAIACLAVFQVGQSSVP